jgi:hypothetical protein
MQNKFSPERIERIMESLDGMQPAAVPHFFYTRLKAKMQPAEKKNSFLLLRPAFITAALAVFLLLNVFSLFTINKMPEQNISEQYTGPASIESFAKAYNLESENIYE